jgi:TonB family protein
MTPEIEAYANQAVAHQILRRGRILADQAIRQDRQGEMAWRILWATVFLIICAAVLEMTLVPPMLRAYQHHFGRKPFYILPPVTSNDMRSPVINAYRQEVRNRLDRAGNPDSWPGKLSGRDGATGITLRINPDGSLDRAIIYQSAGDPVLDTRACEVAYAAAPFAPFPKEMEDFPSLRVSSYMAFNYGQAVIDCLFLNTKTIRPRDCDVRA